MNKFKKYKKTMKQQILESKSYISEAKEVKNSCLEVKDLLDKCNNKESLSHSNIQT